MGWGPTRYSPPTPPLATPSLYALERARVIFRGACPPCLMRAPPSSAGPDWVWRRCGPSWIWLAGSGSAQSNVANLKRGYLMADRIWVNGVMIQVVEMHTADGVAIPGIQTFTPLVPFGNHVPNLTAKKDGTPLLVFGDCSQSFGKAGVDLKELSFPGEDGTGMLGYFLKHSLYTHPEKAKVVQPVAAPNMPELFAAQGGSTEPAGVIRGKKDAKK